MYGTYGDSAGKTVASDAEKVQRIMTLRRDIARLKGNVGISKIERDIATLEGWWSSTRGTLRIVNGVEDRSRQYTATEACADLALPVDQRTARFDPLKAPWDSSSFRSADCARKQARLDEKRLLLSQEQTNLAQKEAELAALIAQPSAVSEPVAPLLLPAPPPTFAPMPPSLPAEAAVLSRPSPNYLLWGGAAVAAYFFLRR